MGAALRGKDFLVSDAHSPPAVAQKHHYKVRLSRCRDLIFWHLLCPILQVLALPGLVWKQLTGEAVSWNKDFPAVDSVLVRTFKLLQLHNSHINVNFSKCFYVQHFKSKTFFGTIVINNLYFSLDTLIYCTDSNVLKDQQMLLCGTLRALNLTNFLYCMPHPLLCFLFLHSDEE